MPHWLVCGYLWTMPLIMPLISSYLLSGSKLPANFKQTSSVSRTSNKLPACPIRPSSRICRVREGWILHDSATNERSSVTAFSPKHAYKHQKGERDTFLTDLMQLVELMSREDEHARLRTIKSIREYKKENTSCSWFFAQSDWYEHQPSSSSCLQARFETRVECVLMNCLAALSPPIFAWIFRWAIPSEWLLRPWDF